MEYNPTCSFFWAVEFKYFSLLCYLIFLFWMWINSIIFLIKKKKRQAHVIIRKGTYTISKHPGPSWHEGSCRFCFRSLHIWSSSGTNWAHGDSALSASSNTCHLLWPNQHLVICINSAQSGHTLGPSQEKCQPLLTRANGWGMRFHLPVWTSQGCPGSCLARPSLWMGHSSWKRAPWKKTPAPVSLPLFLCLFLCPSLSLSIS